VPVCTCPYPSPSEKAQNHITKYSVFAMHAYKYAELNLQIRTLPAYFNVKAKLSIIAAFPMVFNRNCF